MDAQAVKIKPRLIIHGGAGNIQRRSEFPPEKYEAYRYALISIVSRTSDYMNQPSSGRLSEKASDSGLFHRPSALAIATFAVKQLEDNPLFNAGHGAVFTRDGINELEASVMVSRGFKKRAVGVMGLRRVRNPILLAKKLLEHGEDDLEVRGTQAQHRRVTGLDVPSGQGHSQISGAAAEQLADQYGLELVDPSYFFTQRRWDEHVRALQREERGEGSATWSAFEYLPQGTCGAVALDETGVICAATSTGGLTNKLTGRIGDTPTIGAGFWAEEWTEDGDPTGQGTWGRLKEAILRSGPAIVLSDTLLGTLADCLPSPRMYYPVDAGTWTARGVTSTRAMGASGTGNGDSFLRTNAVRTIAAMARWKPESTAKALTNVAGPGGELEKSAGDRWRRTGEGEGGVIGIECTIIRDSSGSVVDARSEVVMDFNCTGMFRAWIDDDGKPVMSIWSNDPSE